MPAADKSANATDTTVRVLVEALGVVVEVCFASPGPVVDAFRSQWSRALVEQVAGRSASPTARVEAPADTTDDVALHSLTSQVTMAAIEAQAGELVMLHAAGLADPDTGLTVALVAPSGTGKTTSAAHLGRRWAYLTDETVAVTPEGLVHPHPKPLSIVRPGQWVKDQVSPDQLGLMAPHGPARLAALVLLVRDGSTPASVERLRRSVAIARLAEHTSYLARLPEPLAALDRLVSSTAGCWEVRYDFLEDLEACVAQVMAEASAAVAR